MKTAVLYLRVSTTSQVQTDHDPEGISIPAQRLACQRKAEQMGVTVIDEYVEPGKSATTIEKRPIFQAMLARLKSERDADYVIVYNLSRLNRNRVDDTNVLMMMRAMKVTLISAQENIDETPAGQLMHGILAAFNEYRSNADGADIRYKMGQKAKNGGTVTRTKVGYLNVRERIDGHEIRSVAIDEERAPLIRLAFELCATGDYTMGRLTAILTERGLRMRPRADRPLRPISPSHLAKILRDRYYLGLVTYDGEEYPGRHMPIVTQELFAQVQRVLDARLPQQGERQRKHDHYLKSTLWCGRCHARGVASRLILTRGRGNGGDYFYFICTARQDRLCDAPYVRTEAVEAAVLRHYATLSLPSGFAAQVRTVLADALSDEERSAHLLHDQLTRLLADLDAKEENLLDLVEAGGAVAAKVRTRLAVINQERDHVREALQDHRPRLEAGAALIRAALDLLDDPQELYRQTTNEVRRQLNQVFYGKLYLDADEVVDDELMEPFDGLLYHRNLRKPTGAPRRSRAPKTTHGAPKDAASRYFTCAALLDRIACGDGSSKAAMVGDTGIEPVTPAV